MNIDHLFSRANRALDAQENRLNEIQQQFNNMSTIHTAMTGKTDSLIDAVRESVAKPVYHTWMSRYSDPYGTGVTESVPPINCIADHTHPDHPDYMRMVVHQMD